MPNKVHFLLSKSDVVNSDQKVFLKKLFISIAIMMTIIKKR